MKLMRFCLGILVLALTAFAHDGEMLHGKLAIHGNAPATIETDDHKVIQLSGDDTTNKVLTDSRLNGFDIQVKGRFTAPTRFEIGPSHEHSMLVRSQGKLQIITYYCDVCNIRDYTPGPCRCCQKELTLELRDPDAK